MTDEEPTRSEVLDAMRALLSDDHNHDRGLAVLRDLVDDVVRRDGTVGLREFTVALALGVASVLERSAREQGLAAADLAEAWFAE